jgi:hypothetical protein
MTTALSTTGKLALIPSDTSAWKPMGLLAFMDLLGITDVSSGRWAEKLPFAPADVTAGTENELQVAIAGRREEIDLAQAIETSNYYKNIVKRVASGDAPRKILSALDDYLAPSNRVWENSWVRLPLDALNAYARSVLETDILADKRCCDGPRRCDSERFFITLNARTFLRIPISYLLKLSLAQAIGHAGVPRLVRQTGEKMLGHFLNDNTSPETHSFFPVTYARPQGLGKATVDETLLRYLLTQLAVQYANRHLRIEEHGQRAIVYFAPHPPVRQKQLNDLIPDAFYRELFMSPCLSGWEQGEAKHSYMILCHEVLSRSQLNALAKLKEAGIVANNLVVLPRTSNVCLANNGTHLSLGSRKLSQLMADGRSGFGARDEKQFGDLVIKISEHFLPLCVGTYSAAPYRLDFADFHPEKVLGFLPHELDYTHLRMLWRRWKHKADINFCGRPVTPFGPEWLDRAIGKALHLSGDLVHDYRLIDYLVAVLSTDESPSLDGRLDNDVRLKADLADMGIFDRRMSLYLLLRLRQFKTLGFSGFEARHYSLFENFDRDMRPAVDVQQLITLLAYDYILRRTVTHADIPDNPTVESERRQFFFGAAIGIPTFYIHQQSANRFMQRILKHCRHTRPSRRYGGYLRVPGIEYQRALIRLLREDGRELIEMLRLGSTLEDLEQRIDAPREHAVAQRIVGRVSGGKKNLAARRDGREFNEATEYFYRETLRKDHLREAYAVFRQAVRGLDSWQFWRDGYYNSALLGILDGRNADEFAAAAERDLLAESLPAEACQRLIQLLLLVLHDQLRQNSANDTHRSDHGPASVH